MRKLSVLLLCCSCATLKLLTVARPTADFETVRVDRADLAGADLQVVFRVQNPNGSALKLDQVSYELDLEGKKVLSGAPPNGLEVPPGSSEVAFPAHVVWLAVIDALAAPERDLHYRVAGTLGLTSPLGPVSLPLEHEGTLPAPRLPQISLAGARMNGASRIEISIQILNPNSFPLPIARLAADAQVSGQSVGHLDSPPHDPIAPGQSATLVLPLQLDLLRAGFAVAEALQQGKLDVGLDGSLDLAGATLPLHLRGTIPLQH